MEKFTVDGLVIRVSATGESDRIVWVLTRSRGLIRAFAKGARGTKSKLHGGTSLFTYCDFSFYEKKQRLPHHRGGGQRGVFRFPRQL